MERVGKKVKKNRKEIGGEGGEGRWEGGKHTQKKRKRKYMGKKSKNNGDKLRL